VSEEKDYMTAMPIRRRTLMRAKLERYFAELARRYSCTSDDAFNACFEVGFDNVPELLAKRLEAKK
jgi:hypothetical protein